MHSEDMTPGASIMFTPPASAVSHSPRRSASTANWGPTSDEEQAVSTESAGPFQPNAYETRPEAMLEVVPVPMYSLTSAESRTSWAYSELLEMPMNTPVELPRISSGCWPAFSSASQDTSNNCRCWGSIALASNGEILKNLASKAATSRARKLLCRMYILPGLPGVGS